ncbi:hypothetical protein BKA56DRAFT_93221 [Ilyonectria sp. MPI-CAGE-AT-0026]|nr:hypothetical protein BKA56DRAFT_93221 [Ilyonectria sp. MPI-CAGE-AT-0026]
MLSLLATNCDCSGISINETANSITLSATDANPDISGIGVIAAACSTAIVTAATSIFLLVLKCIHLFRNTPEQVQARAAENKSEPRHIAEAMLLTLSDQQLVIAPATLITAGLEINWCTLSAYHMNIVCYTAVLAIVTHLGSLVTQSHYFQYRAVGTFRAIMILITVVLTALFANKRTSKYFPVTNDSQLQAAPAACLVNNNSTLWDNLTDGDKEVVTNSGVIEFYFLLASYILALIIAAVHSRHIVHKGRHVGRQRVSWVFCVAVILICVIILCMTLYRLVNLRNWMIKDSELLTDGDTENEWGFGQLLPIFLFGVMTLYAVLGAFSDYMQEKPLYKEKGRNSPTWSRKADAEQQLLDYPPQNGTQQGY